MRLPFTRPEFLGVFAAYNRAVWPAALLLWIAAAAIAIALLSRRPPAGRTVAAFLALMWLWTGVVYHAIFFRRVNVLAPSFAFFFVLEAGLLAGIGAFGRKARVEGRGPRRLPEPGFRLALRTRWRAAAGAAFLAAALLYPFAALAAGERWPRTPGFGVPCPTVLFTVGVLLRSELPFRELVEAIPLLWCVVGGSAAVLLAMPVDFSLWAAGVALVADIAAERRRRKPVPRD